MTAVLDSLDFGFSGFHYAGEGGSGVDGDGRADTGSSLAAITGLESGSYNSTGGALNAVFILDDMSTVTLSAHGSKLMSKVADSISELIEESIREQNFASVVGAGRYAIIIPGVAAFKENVIVSRLQRAVAKLAFSFIDDADKLELAVGITST